MESKNLACPVCKTHLNGTTRCAGCGADLSRVLVVAVSVAKKRKRPSSLPC